MKTLIIAFTSLGLVPCDLNVGDTDPTTHVTEPSSTSTAATTVITTPTTTMGENTSTEASTGTTTTGTATTGTTTAGTTTTEAASTDSPTDGTGVVCGDGEVDRPEECDPRDCWDKDSKLALDDCLKTLQCYMDCTWAPRDNHKISCTDKEEFCVPATCGDGKVNKSNFDKDAPVEECDNGDANTGAYGGCTTECTQASHCGDGVWDKLRPGSEEDCDDSNTENGDGCTSDCKDEFVIFVTEATFAGNIGFDDDGKMATPPCSGLLCADTVCKNEAQKHGLTGTYKAWLSTGSENAKADMPTGKNWFLRNGATVGATGVLYNDVADNVILQHPINVIGSGLTELLNNQQVWTGTNAGGTSASTCLNWTTADGKEIGSFGSVSATTQKWTYLDNELCSAKLHLYCFRAI